jgi:hypothetical protein
MRHDVQVEASGGRAVFVLAKETDPDEGTVDLTPMLRTLVVAGLSHPHTDPEDGVPFGALETEGDITVTVDGRALTEDELCAALGAGFIHVIKQAIDREYAAADLPGEDAARPPVS